MDHKWGRNVIELGLGDLGITLAAVVSINPRVIVTNAPGAPIGSYWDYLLPADTQVAYSRSTTAKVPGHVRFPYGRAVVPDVYL